MASAGWREFRIGELVLINCASYSPKENWPFINYLETGSITDNRVSKLKHLVPSEDRVPSRARRKINPGDILYSTVRPNQRHYGRLREVPDNFLASTGFAVLSGRKGVADSGFLYRFLTQDHIVEYLQTIAETSTSAYPSIKASDLESLSVSLPPLNEQRVVARILDGLDDKIELNRRMCRTLEEMAQALFKSWFVDFDPVRAKMEGRWRPGESLPGLPAHLYDLFPDRLVGSELGPIPEGWDIVRIGDVARSTKGSSYRRFELADSDTALVTLKSFKKGGGYRKGGLKPYVGSYKPEQVLEPGDIVVACTDVSQAAPVIGRAALVAPSLRHDTLVASLDVVSIRPTSAQVSKSFLYQLCGDYRFVTTMKTIATGTTVLHLKPSDIEDFRFPIPPPEIVEHHSTLNRLVAHSMYRYAIDDTLLSDIRDTLLSRLLSGELRVPMTSESTTE